jgi:hypothetical protein
VYIAATFDNERARGQTRTYDPKARKFTAGASGVIRRLGFALALGANPRAVGIDAPGLDAAHAVFVANLYPASDSTLLLGASRRAMRQSLGAFMRVPALDLAFVRADDPYLCAWTAPCAPGAVERPAMLDTIYTMSPGGRGDLFEVTTAMLEDYETFSGAGYGVFAGLSFDPCEVLFEFRNLAICARAIRRTWRSC